METNTPNDALENVTSQPVEGHAPAEVIDPSDPRHPDHPEHHKHMSALHAAGKAHSAVNHVLPHHRGLDL